LPRLGRGRRCENRGFGELIDSRRPDGVGQADPTQRDPQHDDLDETVTVDQRDQHRGGEDDPDRGPGGGAIMDNIDTYVIFIISESPLPFNNTRKTMQTEG
jgi:hypothetical protein